HASLFDKPPQLTSRARTSERERGRRTPVRLCRCLAAFVSRRQAQSFEHAVALIGRAAGSARRTLDSSRLSCLPESRSFGTVLGPLRQSPTFASKSGVLRRHQDLFFWRRASGARPWQC